MANPNKWIIEQGTGAGSELDGLKIKKTDNNYELYAVLATTPIPSPATGPVNFNNVNWDDQTWNLSIPGPITPGQNATGTWTLPGDDADVPGTPQSGDFTAQADDDMDADEAASSATA